MMNTNDAVSLDFWNGLAFYSGKSFPCGTIGCDALNIPTEVIEKLKELCTVQYALINALTFGPGNPAPLSAARESAQQIAKLLKNVKPFSYTDVPDVEDRIERIFSEAYLNNAIEYSAVFGGSTLDILSNPKYEQGKTLLRTLPVLAQLGYSLEQYQQTMLAFAEKLNDPGFKRTPQNIATLFGKCFPKIEKFENNAAWMAMTNATTQYTTLLRPDSNTPVSAKHMIYVSFVGMFRSDLYEGLCAGHAPKKCRTCGRWFLTINARPTKYCGGYAPGDKRHRSCRQVGNLKGRKERESAKDHPYIALYKKRMNSINRRIKRNRIDPELAKLTKKLAKDKMQRAEHSVRYANGKYIQEMELDALEAEAKALL